MLKTLLINTTKFMIAGGLIVWLLQSGKLDLSLLGELASFPLAVALACFFQVLNYLLTSWRWKLIISSRAQTIMPFGAILKINWIGQFFSSVLPGSVSGDLVKLFYIQSIDKTLSKKFVFASILIDRIMGLSGLILLVGISSLIFSNHILESAPDMEGLLNINYLLSFAVISSLLLFFFFHSLLEKLLLLGKEKTPFTQVFDKLLILFLDLVSIKTRMVKAVAISILVQFCAVLIFWNLISPFVAEKMDFIQALAFIPIGLMTLALPIAPSGLGVGHAIFQKLFEFSGITNGASLFNLYFVLTLVLNLLGVIPYLLFKKKN